MPDDDLLYGGHMLDMARKRTRKRLALDGYYRNNSAGDHKDRPYGIGDIDSNGMRY